MSLLMEIMVAIGDSLSDLASSDNGGDGHNANDEETEQGQLSEDDGPGWVMGTITKTVQLHMERFRQQEKKVEELTQPGSQEAAYYLREIDGKHGTSGLWVPAVFGAHRIDDAASLAATTIGELVECLDSLPGIAQMPPGTSRPGSSHIKL